MCIYVYRCWERCWESLLVVTIWSFERLTAPVVTTTSVIFSSNKIQNGDILVLINSDPSGKWPLKWRERKKQDILAHDACSQNMVEIFTMTKMPDGVIAINKAWIVSHIQRSYYKTMGLSRFTSGFKVCHAPLWLCSWVVWVLYVRSNMLWVQIMPATLLNATLGKLFTHTCLRH